jgi:hypothetical protein
MNPGYTAEYEAGQPVQGQLQSVTLMCANRDLEHTLAWETEMHKYATFPLEPPKFPLVVVKMLLPVFISSFLFAVGGKGLKPGIGSDFEPQREPYAIQLPFDLGTGNSTNANSTTHLLGRQSKSPYVFRATSEF